MNPTPLPIPARCYAGESVDSYGRRLAELNSLDWREVERAAFDSGFLSRRALNPAERNALWRALGALQDHAFAASSFERGASSTERELCLRCCHGHRAVGRRPEIGLVCLRHRRWLGPRQRQIGELRDLIRAERQFRRDLAPRGIHFDSPPMELGREAARIMLASRGYGTQVECAGANDPDLLGYPDQVRFTSLICQPSFLRAISQPGREGSSAATAAISALVEGLGIEDADAWRLRTRLWELSSHLRKVMRNREVRPTAAYQDEYRLLQLVAIDGPGTQADVGPRPASSYP